MYDLTGDWSVVGVGDFNGDWMDDILLRNADGRVTTLLGAGYDGSFTENPNADYQMLSNWQVLGTGDFNGDGRDEPVWRNEDGALSEWLGQTNGAFWLNSNVSYQMGGNWQMLGTGDFNGDGRTDLLWRNEEGALSEWVAQPDGTFWLNTNVSYQMPGNWEFLGTGDFNGDGRDDVIWRNEQGALSEWIAQSDGTFWNSPSATYPMLSNWQMVGAGDFNGDGRDDLLWQNEQSALSQWVAQSDGTFQQGWTASGGSTGSAVAGIGDFNADGRDDVLWRDFHGTVDAGLSDADGALQTPEDKQWEEALAAVSEFFDAITSQVSGYSSGNDQNSYYDDGSDHSPFEPLFMKMWGFLPSVQSHPAAHYWDFLTRDIDPEFEEFVLNSLAGAGFSGTFGNSAGGNNMGSMTQEADGTAVFNMNGMLMRGTWHPFATSQEPTPDNAIVITGNNVGYWTFERIGFMGFNPAAGYAPPNNGGGSSGVTPNATSCVETSFATPGVSLADANREALEASNEIASQDDEHYEYSSIIYSLNGVVGHTDSYTDHLPDQVRWLGRSTGPGISQVPDGAVILGIVHSHPDDHRITDTIPSGAGREDGDDWIMYRTLVNWNNNHDNAHDLPRGITVDPNMLLWIYSNEDHKTHVYDNTDKSQTAPSCTLQ